MKKIFTFLISLVPLFSSAQLTDNFSDGDFTNNPAWTGDISQFIVNASQQLQLNSSGAATSYLVTSDNSPSLNNTQWQFYIHLNLAPSSQNYARVYLVSDQNNIEGSLNGYYLQFGETNANDAIELFRQTGTSSLSVARGTNGFIANAFTISVKITRDNSGLWSIYADPAAGTNFVLQATGTDITYNSSSWFGVVCTYSSTNATNFYFDDFAWPYTPDITPPNVSAINVISSNQIDVHFNEPVEQISAETISNYSVNNGIGNPSSAISDATDQSLVHLTFANSFQNGVQNTLSVLNVKDISNNAITVASTGQFTYYAPVVADSFDVVISEIYFQFGTSGLPDAEYVELYNRSNKTLNLNGWTIADANNSPAAFGNIILPPGEYLIVCTISDAPLLTQFGTVTGVSGFPGLNDDGDDIKIADNNAVLIDEVNYDETYYNNPDRDGGGYSIERIDRDFTCPNNLNWRASEEFLGGTPGKLNSVTGTFTDNESPRLVRAFISASNKVTGIFSEPLSILQLSVLSNYSIDNSIGTPVAVNILSSSKIELSVSGSFSPAVTYTLSVNSSIKDCPGNAINKTTAKFQYPDSADISDVIINEVLYHPADNGSEFIELYNRSAKVIDLGALRLSEVNIDSNTLIGAIIISPEPYLIFPGDYTVLTKNQVAVKTAYTTDNIDGFINMSSFPSLNDDDDEFAIADLSSKRIDQFYYNSDYQFPLLNDDKGVSLERISFNRPAQDSTNWHSAAETVGFATPAYENSQHAETIDDGSEVSVQPEIFSPDNDDNNDVVFIHYHFDSPGYTANLKIFDSKGRLMIHLVKNELIGIEGSFTWDGINNENEKAKVGIYVAYLEVFNAEGKVKKFKKPLVLASKL